MQRNELGSGNFQSKDGKNWEPAIPEPYHRNLYEWLLCKLGYHSWPQFSKRYILHPQQPNSEYRAVCIYCDYDGKVVGRKLK